MGDLEQLFESNNQRLIYKWNHYFDIYERHFSQYRGQEIVILEIGVFHGGSLQLWKKYFGSRAKVYGIDINPDCKSFEEENIEIFIGSQSDRHFLQEVKIKIPPIDILIDDGGHSMQQQIVTFEELYGHVKSNGVYLCEDLHTSYWLDFGGGYKRRGTYIEYTKSFVDKINAFHSKQKALQADDFTRSTNSIHYYDSVIVLEKKDRTKPFIIKSGSLSFENIVFETIPTLSFKEKARHKIIQLINKFLRFFRLPSFIWK